MTIPKELYRITKHTKPRYQLYQPGFNTHNSCWLDGKWIDVPKTEWEQRKDEHQKLSAVIKRRMKSQHYRDEGKKVEDLTPAERQAYEFYSGEGRLDCLIHDCAQPVHVEMVGANVSAKSIAWLREQGYKVITNVKQPDGTVTSQLGQGIPDDLMIDTGEAYDVWKNIVATNKKRQRETFDAFLEGSQDPLVAGVTIGGLSLPQTMVTQGLLEVEVEIIREEHNLSIGQKPDRYTDLVEERKNYAEMRAKLEAKGFHDAYEQAKVTHNECARHNLDSSNGRMYNYVLPKFNPDGTHEPWGPRDVPWNSPDDEA
jgi:hypothetical protein